MPAVASTDRANPIAEARPGSSSSRTSVATPRRAGAAVAAVGAHPDQGDRAHRGRPQHARLGAREQHEPGDPQRRPPRSSHRPRTRSQRATTSANPTTRVRLVPETASRWVSPVVRKSSASAGSSPASSPSTRAGTSARRSGGRPGDRGAQGAAAGRLTPATTGRAALGPSAGRGWRGRPRRRPACSARGVPSTAHGRAQRHGAASGVAPKTSTGSRRV